MIKQCCQFFQANLKRVDLWRISQVAAIMSAALFLGCSSLTPERVNVLAAIAGQAAALGASEWLAKHPEHRQPFLNALAELGAVLRTNAGPQSLEDGAVSFLAKLPTDTLRGRDGELYVTGGTNGPASLVVWDGALKKGVEVRGDATEPVVRQVYFGLRRALGPKPPVPGGEKAIGWIMSVTPEALPDSVLDEQFRRMNVKNLPVLKTNEVHEFPFLK